MLEQDGGRGLGTRKDGVAIWGKLLGGVLGFLTGGPLGAAMGVAMGHAADSGNAQPYGFAVQPGAALDAAALLGRREDVFSIAVIVLAAKLAKSDGPVKRVEIDAFKRFFRVPPEAMPQVAALYDAAREDWRGYEPFAERLAEAFTDNRALLEEVLAALFEIARADGPVTVGEARMLREIHRILGLAPAAWDRAALGQTPPRPGADEPDPYEVLGVARDSPPEAVRAAWLQLMRENHPDKLAAQGVPPEFIAAATEKVARINAAWDHIKRERGL